MINIKALTIAYDGRVIFDNVNVAFKRGTITVIQGKSGSGKSSFLNVLGLMQTAAKCEYSFDNTVVSKLNDSERADFRLHNVGFVFQQSNLIQELTAKENLIVPMTITQQNNISEKADELISYVGLEEVKNSYPGSLSGGEEQRLAIARAIANDADIILADEPTASLDAENSTKVLELFSRLAHELNKIVILVSHSEFVPKYADVICEIKNRDLIVTKSATAENISQTTDTHGKAEKKRNVFRFVRYYTRKRSGDKILNRVFIAVTALVAAAAILSTNFGANFASETSIDILDRSILVVNNTLNLRDKAGQVDYEEALVISPDTIGQIESLANVGKVYPWYNFFSFSSYGLSHSETSLANIKIMSGSTIIAEKSYENPSLPPLPRDRFTICPLYDEEYHDISSILESKSGLDISTGLVLTKSLANKFSDNPDELIDKTIEISCFVPTKVAETINTVVAEDGTLKQVLIDRAYYKLVTVKGTVTGVLKSAYATSRTRELDLVLMNSNQLINIINANKDMHFDENQKELGPSALVIFADTYTDVPAATLQLKTISAQFSVVNNISTGGSIIEDTFATTRTILLAVTIVFVGIVAVLFGLLYHLKNRPRKREFGILKAIGFTKSNIMTLTSIEMLWVALPAYIISIAISVMVMILGNSVSGKEYFSITFLSILVGLLICVIVVVVAGMLPVRSAINVDPVDAIRKINK